MRLRHLLPAFSLVLACSSDQAKPDLVRLEGNLDGCANVQQVCLESFPPQCFDFCADEDPGAPGGDGDCAVIFPDGVEPSDTDITIATCDEQPCRLGETDDGTQIQICYPPDCTVSWDGSTETVECPPGGGDDDGGSEPGNPGEPTEPRDPECVIDGVAGFLEYPEGSCGFLEDPSTCVAIPEACTEQYAPVCGCDGATYANDCFARGAAMNIAHQGECDERQPLPL